MVQFFKNVHGKQVSRTKGSSVANKKKQQAGMRRLRAANAERKRTIVALRAERARLNAALTREISKHDGPVISTEKVKTEGFGGMTTSERAVRGKSQKVLLLEAQLAENYRQIGLIARKKNA